MALFDPAFALLGELPKYLAKMPPQFPIEHLPAVLRDKNDVVFALPFAVT
jgi:hypothetical protein